MLDQKEFVKQAIGLQRAACSVVMSGMVTFWKQTETALDTLLDQADWLPAEGKKTMKQWTGTTHRGCSCLQTAMDEGFERLEKCFEAGKNSSGAER